MVEPKEEEEDEAMEDDEEDDAEVINPYEEADPHNRPPPTSDEESEYAPPVVLIADVDNIPIPPVIQFGNFHVGESSASRDLLEGSSKVCVPGPMPCDLRSVHRGVKRNGQAFDITALDSAVRANRSESSKMMKLITDLSREFFELKSQNPAIRDEHERIRREATRAEGPARDPVTAPIARECLFASFIKCGRTQFYGTESAVGLVCWFEKMENTLKSVNVQKLEDELRHLKLRDMNIAAYTERFNELAVLCPDVVLNEKKKVELYIKDLPKIIKGETTSSRPVTLNEAVRMAHALMEQKIQSKNERIAVGFKRKTMPPKIRSQTNSQLTLTQEDVDQLVQAGIAAAIRDEHERIRREATRAEGPARDPVTAPIARECLFASFIKCGRTQFYGTESAVGLVCWFEKMENTLKSVNVQK
nr:hypothetical protein [Tanacetum cinerariifolium]